MPNPLRFNVNPLFDFQLDILVKMGNPRVNFFYDFVFLHQAVEPAELLLHSARAPLFPRVEHPQVKWLHYTTLHYRL